MRLLFAFLLLLTSSSALAQTYTARSLGGPDKAYIREMHITPSGDIFIRTVDGWYIKDAEKDTFEMHLGTFWDPDHIAIDSTGRVFGLIDGEIKLLNGNRSFWVNMTTPFPSKKPAAKISIDDLGNIYSSLGNVIAQISKGLVVDLDTLPATGAIRETYAVGDTLVAITSTRIYAQVNDGQWMLLDTLPSATTSIEFSPYGYVIGTATSGIYLLDRIGGEWRFISDNQPDWQVNDVLYHNGRIYSANGNNLYTTSDLGQTWIEGTGRIRTMPVNVLAEHDGRIYAGTGREGLFYSDNEGVTWSAYNGGFAESWVTSIYEYKGDIYTGSNINAVHRLSSDGKWTDQHNGIRAGATITAFTDRNDTLYALDDRSGLYKWVSDSSAWIKKPLTFTVSSEYMDMDWLDDRTLVVVSEGVEILDVPTNSFTRTQFGENQIYDLEIAEGKMYIAVNDGLRVSEDRGENWRLLRTGKMTKVLAFGQTILAQLIDGNIWRSNDAGETWSQIAKEFGGIFRAGDLVFSRSKDSLLYTDLQSGWRLAMANILKLNELALTPTGRLLAGLNDRGLFELLPVSAVEPHQASKPDDLKIYPNPAGKSVTIETDAASIEVYNALGQFVASIERPVGSTVTFAVSDLTPGVYSLKAMTSEGVRTTRLIVTR